MGRLRKLRETSISEADNLAEVFNWKFSDEEL
jgi:hypothetical protein